MNFNPELYTNLDNNPKDSNKYCPICQLFLFEPVYNEINQRYECNICISKDVLSRDVSSQEFKDITTNILQTPIECSLCNQRLDLNNLENHVESKHPDRIDSLFIDDNSRAETSLACVSFQDELVSMIEDDYYFLKYNAEDPRLLHFTMNKMKKFERDLHGKVKMELNTGMHDEFSRYNIPKLAYLIKAVESEPKNEEIRSNKKEKEKPDHFQGSLSEIMHKNEKDDCVFYYTLKGNTQDIFIFPKDFRLYDHYVYSFFAYRSRDSFRSYDICNVVVNRNYPLLADASNWSETSWKSLLNKCRTETSISNEITEQLNNLHPDAFNIPPQLQNQSLFEKYFYHIRQYIPNVIRFKLELLKDFKFFFFNNEMQDLYKTWVPSMECLAGMNIDLLFVLYHLFNPDGDPEIKKKYFNYLFFRPKKVKINIFDTYYRISEFFLCKSKKYEWPFPKYNILEKTEIANHVFSKLKRKPASLTTEYKILIYIYNIKKNTDTCVYLSQIMNELVTQKIDPSYILKNLADLKSIMVVDKKEDQMLVTWNYEQYSKMLELGISNILNNFIIHYDEFIAKSFNEFHPNSDLHYRAKYESMNFCGKQELALYYAQKLPILFIDGEAGRGKTAVEGKIAQYFDKNEVLYLSSHNTTVYSVGLQNVCKRAFTVTRFLILHDATCFTTSNFNPHHNQHVIFKNSKRKHAKHHNGRSFKFQNEQIYEGKKYYNEQFECCFDQCILEDVKCVFIDESSLLDIVNACRIFYVISMCCHPTVRVIIAGDGGQLASIAAGMVHKDFQKIFNPWMVKLDIDHRFVGDSALKNIANNESIREGKFNNIHFDLKTVFNHNTTAEYIEDKIEINENVRFHFLETNEIKLNIKETDQERNTRIIKLLKPTLDYLIKNPYYLGRVEDVGETLNIHLCCPTNLIKNLINQYITDEIFVPKIPRRQEVSYISHMDGYKVDVFRGMKIIYRKNLYDKINLCNNLIYIVVRIQDVKFKSKKSKKDKGDGDQAIEDTESEEDDIITEEANDSYLLNAGGSLSVERSSKTVVEDYQKYADPEFVIDGHENLYATHYVTKPLGIGRGSYGRRLLVVPANDIDNLTGKVKTWENQRIIPWNHFHWPFISRASTTTIFGSQGREFDKIVLICPSFYEERDVNQMLYVGTSRSKTTVTIATTENILKNIVNNFQKKRKSHFPSYMQPILKKYYENPLFQIKEIPEYIQQKLAIDAERIKTRDQKIALFRNNNSKDFLPSLSYAISSVDKELNLDKAEEEKLKALTARLMQNAGPKKSIFLHKREKRDREFPKDNNDAERFEPIQKKQQPQITQTTEKDIHSERQGRVLMAYTTLPTEMTQKRR